MIGNVLEEERGKLGKHKGPTPPAGRGWTPKELQHTLGAFLSEEGALTFLEELWVLLLDAQTSPDGIPQAWGPEQRAKYMAIEEISKKIEPEKKIGERLGLHPDGPSMCLRSPDRVLGRLIGDAKEDSKRRSSRPRQSTRYFDDRSPDRRDTGNSPHTNRYADDHHDHYRLRPKRDEGEIHKHHERTRESSVAVKQEHRPSERRRGRERGRFPSPDRTPPLCHIRDSSADTYGSVTPRRERSRTPKRERSRTPVRHHGRERSRTSVRRNVTPRRERSRTPARNRSPSHSPKQRVHSRSPSAYSRSRSPKQSEKKKKKHHHYKKKHHHRKPMRDQSRSRSRSPEDHIGAKDMGELERMLRQKALESISRT